MLLLSPNKKEISLSGRKSSSSIHCKIQATIVPNRTMFRKKYQAVTKLRKRKEIKNYVYIYRERERNKSYNKDKITHKHIHACILKGNTYISSIFNK